MAGLASLAALAAIAIHGARLLEGAQQAVTRERAANDALNDRAAELAAASTAHETMIELLARDGGLQDLVEQVSQLLSCEAAVVDAQFRTLTAPAASSGPGWTRVGAAVLPAALSKATRDSMVSGRSAMKRLTPRMICRVAPILGGTARLGALAVWREADLSEPETRTLERGAVVAAIMLMADERLKEAANRDARETLSALLHAQVSPSTRRQTKRARTVDGLSWPLKLYLIDSDAVRPSQLAAAIKPLIARHGAIAAEHQTDFVVLCGVRTDPSLEQHLQAIIGEETGVTPNVAVSEVAREASELPERYRNAQWTLRMMRKLEHSGQIGHEALFTPYAPLFRDRTRDEIGSFVLAAIGPLTKYDKVHGSRLAETLLTFLDLGKRLQASANSLGIHVNTARQRLATIERVCPGWNAPKRSLDTHLALRLHAINHNGHKMA